MTHLTHKPELKDYYQHGTYNYQQYQYDLDCWESPDGIPNSDLFDLDGHPRDSYDDTETSYQSEPAPAPKTPSRPVLTPAIQERIDKARAEIKARKKDSQWGAICVATKDLIEGNHKIAARNLIQTYLKAHQR